MAWLVTPASSRASPRIGMRKSMLLVDGLGQVSGGAVAVFPREFQRRLTAPLRLSRVHQALDTAELEGASGFLPRFHECLDFFIGVLVLPGRHQGGAPMS